MRGKEGRVPSSVPSETSRLTRSLSSTASIGLLFTGVCTPLFVAKLLLCDPRGIICETYARALASELQQLQQSTHNCNRTDNHREPLMHLQI